MRQDTIPVPDPCPAQQVTFTFITKLQQDHPDCNGTWPSEHVGLVTPPQRHKNNSGAQGPGLQTRTWRFSSQTFISSTPRQVDNNGNHGLYRCHLPGFTSASTVHSTSAPPQMPGSRSQAQEGTWPQHHRLCGSRTHDTQWNDTVMNNSMGCSALVFGGFFGIPHTYLSTNKSKSSAFTQTSSSEHIQRKIYIQRLTCLLPAPLRMRHGPLWLLWDRTSQSSVQLQTLFVNAPTARNKYQQLVLNPLPQVQIFFPAFSPSQCCFHNKT